MKWQVWACAATSIAAIAGTYIYFHNKPQPPGLTLIQIIKRDTYIKICKEMQEYFSGKYQIMLKKCRQVRRSLQSSSHEYEKCISLFNQETKKLAEEAQDSILNSYLISKKTFENSVNYFDSDPDLQQYVKDIVNTQIPIDSKNILPRDLAKEILDYYQDRLREFESDCPDLDEYMIINSQIGDEIFNVYGVEIEVLTGSWEVYKREFEEMYEPLRNQTYCVLASSDNSF